jgi:hypothetical protein
VQSIISLPPFLMSRLQTRFLIAQGITHEHGMYEKSGLALKD